MNQRKTIRKKKSKKILVNNRKKTRKMRGGEEDTINPIHEPVLTAGAPAPVPGQPVTAPVPATVPAPVQVQTVTAPVPAAAPITSPVPAPVPAQPLPKITDIDINFYKSAFENNPFPYYETVNVNRKGKTTLSDIYDIEELFPIFKEEIDYLRDNKKTPLKPAFIRKNIKIEHVKNSQNQPTIKST